MHYIFVANWKMELFYNEAQSLLDEYRESLSFEYQNPTLILCPSFDVLTYAVAKTKDQSQFFIGAQDCSFHNKGPYTGQIAATSLEQIGISHCIVGHSERREYQHETNEEVFAKAEQLIKNNIVPIICIGETRQEYEAGKTKNILSNQINLCTSIHKKLCPENNPSSLYVAYEPAWAVGSGIVPKHEELAEVISWLRLKMGTTIPLLYGGSLDETNIEEIASIPEINGFLIGKASCDVKKLKNMIKLVYKI